jgi:ankyrin repeat protein
MLLHGEGDAGLNEVDDMGWTALMHAAALGHTEVVKLLVDAGA